jgi:putative acetyltransferase
MERAAVVRSTGQSDRSAILGTVRTAFTGDGHDEQDEVDIVEAIWTRDAGADGLDLVAIRNGQVVGHVLGSWGDLAGRPVVGIAPLAVCPPDQGSGVGTALMQEVIRRGDLARLPLVLLLGDPGYYIRFGFEPASLHGTWYSHGGPGDSHFMVRRLSAFTECPEGEYRYAWEQ